MTFQKAVALSDLWSGEKIGILLDGKKVLLVNTEGKICAYEDRCGHQGVLLSEGRLNGCVLTCQAHYWEYDVSTGKGVNPAAVQLTAFAVKIENGEIFVDVNAPS